MLDITSARNAAVDCATQEDAADRCIALLWPTADNGQTYVHQTLTGGDYISTGLFPRQVIGPRGHGRTIENVSRVTSLLWDADLATLYVALLQARNRPVPARRAQVKEALYRLPAEHLRVLRRVLVDQLVPVWSDIMGMPPTAVLDSGWGVHIHLAVDPLLGLRVQDLASMHIDLTRRMNEAASAVARTVRPSLGVAQLFDRLVVGAQLARMPGTSNTKCSWQHRTVSLLELSPDSVLDSDVWDRLRESVGQQDDLFAGFGDKQTLQVVDSNAPAEANVTSTEVDFELQMCGGRTWSDIAYSMEPGDAYIRVVCPFGGTTPGSGFFARESDGRARYFSNILQRTFWDTVIRKRAVGGHRPRLVSDSLKGKQKVRNSVANLMSLLRGDQTYDLWWCDWSSQVMDGDSPLTDEWWLEVRQHMEEHYDWRWAVTANVILGCAMRVAKERRRNAVTEYLRALRWDGTARLHQWTSKVLGQSKDDALAAEYGLRWAIGLVARALDPGCKNDVMMLLVGKQGIGKSRMWAQWTDGVVRADSPVELFCDSPIDLASGKDAYITYRTCWIHEDAELMAHYSAGPNARKSFLSSKQDTFREPYARYATTVPRKTVSVGTTNSPTPLSDASGSRRYYVLECKRINLQWLATHRDQLLAEATHLFDLGQPWWLEGEWAEAQVERNEAFQRESAWSLVLRQARRNALQSYPNASPSLASVIAHLGAHPQRDISAVSKALVLAGWLRVRGGSGIIYRPSEARRDMRVVGEQTRACLDELRTSYRKWLPK